MSKWILLVLAAVIGAMAIPAAGQTYQRRATPTSRGDSDRGKCTIEVVVDGAADVEVRGNVGTLRNLSGGPPQWRRFECNGVMPSNPAYFRFEGVDGRGRQELVRDPRNGGPAVVRIEDPDGGAEGYTFDLIWGGGGYSQPGGYPQGYPPVPGAGRRFTRDEAVRACQGAVERQAADRFRSRNIAFRRTELDDNPGRRDWVTGIVDVRRGFDRDEAYRYSCSVNFDTGEVRTVQIDPIDNRQDWRRGRDASVNPQALDACERAVEERILRMGYRHVDFFPTNVDNRPGRNDRIAGNARADRERRSDSFEFSCSVNLQNGVIRSVDVRRR